MVTRGKGERGGGGGATQKKGGEGGKKPNFKSEGRHRCQAKVSIKWRSGPDMAGRLQLHLLLPDTERRWRRRGNPLRAQHHDDAFACRSENSLTEYDRCFPRYATISFGNQKQPVFPARLPLTSVCVYFTQHLGCSTQNMDLAVQCNVSYGR